MRWLRNTLLVIVGLIVLVLGVGWLLPVEHTAAVRARIDAPPESVYARILDVEAGEGWREDVHEVVVLSGPNEPVRWRETGDFGSIVMVRDEAMPASRVVARIDDPEQPFGGRWIYRLEPDAGGTRLTITEEGEVYSPLFRFMSKFIFGHYSTLETYVAALGRSFGGEVEIERVESGG